MFILSPINSVPISPKRNAAARAYLSETSFAGGDCGVFALEYIRLRLNGEEDLSSVTDESINAVRRRMAEAIFNHNLE